MSDEQALNAEDEIIETTEDLESDVIEEDQLEESEQDTEETEDEIIVEGEEEQPTSKPKLSGFQRRIGKLNKKVEKATTQAELLAEENKLLRLQIEKTNAPKPLAKPKFNDYDSDAEYEAALEQYEDKRIEQKALEIVQSKVKSIETQQTTAQQDKALEDSIRKHYDRVDTLSMPNYDELEDKAIDVLGRDFVKIIMAKTDKSHLILGHLGANAGKAQAIAEMLQTDPVGALVQAVEIGSKLNIKTKGKQAPDPETKVRGGVQVSSNDNWPAGAKIW